MSEVKKYAHINVETNKVVNISRWDGREYLPAKGSMMVQSDSANIGDDWDPIREEITHIHVIGAPPVIEEEEV